MSSGHLQQTAADTPNMPQLCLSSNSKKPLCWKQARIREPEKLVQSGMMLAFHHGTQKYPHPQVSRILQEYINKHLLAISLSKAVPTSAAQAGPKGSTRTAWRKSSVKNFTLCRYCRGWISSLYKCTHRFGTKVL